VTEYQWHVGQQAVINHDRIVVVEKVSPRGWVTAGGKVFTNGCERTSSRWPSIIQPLTEENRERYQISDRRRRAIDEMDEAKLRLDRWTRDQKEKTNFNPAAVAIMERLVISINAILDEPVTPPGAAATAIERTT